MYVQEARVGGSLKKEWPYIIGVWFSVNLCPTPFLGKADTALGAVPVVRVPWGS